jgi:hypothetical protein
MSNDLFLHTMQAFDQMFDSRESLESPSPATAHRTERVKSSLRRSLSEPSRNGRDAIGARDSKGRHTLTLSNGSTVLACTSEQLSGIWTAWDDNNTSGQAGWGASESLALQDLKSVMEDRLP